MLEKDYYTYILAYPDGTPFYIGKGRGNRIYQHEEEAKNGGQLERHIIIRQIWSDGGQVMRVKVAENLFESDALAFEAYLIHIRNNSFVEISRRTTNKIKPFVTRKQLQAVQETMKQFVPEYARVTHTFVAISQEAKEVLLKNGFSCTDTEMYLPPEIQILYSRNEGGPTIQRFYLGEDILVSDSDLNVLQKG